jgi:hypothetical protein
MKIEYVPFTGSVTWLRSNEAAPDATTVSTEPSGLRRATVTYVMVLLVMWTVTC